MVRANNDSLSFLFLATIARRASKTALFHTRTARIEHRVAANLRTAFRVVGLLHGTRPTAFRKWSTSASRMVRRHNTTQPCIVHYEYEQQDEQVQVQDPPVGGRSGIETRVQGVVSRERGLLGTGTFSRTPDVWNGILVVRELLLLAPVAIDAVGLAVDQRVAVRTSTSTPPSRCSTRQRVPPSCRPRCCCRSSPAIPSHLANTYRTVGCVAWTGFSGIRTSSSNSIISICG
mmetsp:Transcript_10198/g.21870  ORF Transcript_10198/g.21870 Transcript_10198/m.21870 type:complete len:232 (-) Transcript_10198:283-978(-)